MTAGRCCKGVDALSDKPSEFVAINEESNHELVHALRLGEAQRTADKPLDPRPQLDVFTLDFWCVLLAYLMLLGPPGASGCKFAVSCN